MNRRLLCGVLLCGTCLSAPAFGQAITDAVPPQRQNLDSNFVDRATGGAYFPHPALTIGASGRRGLSVTGFAGASGNNTDNGGFPNGGNTNWGLAVYASGSIYSVGLGMTVEQFTLSGSTFTSITASGATLVRSGSSPNYTYTYTAADGTVIVYNYGAKSGAEGYQKVRATKITYPSGEIVTLAWAYASFCSNNLDNCSGGTYTPHVRLQSVSSSLGYQLHYNYKYNDSDSEAAFAAAWNRIVNVTAINTSLDYCDPTAGTCTISHQTPSAMSFSASGDATSFNTSVTDPVGRTYSYVANSTSLSVTTPGHSSANIVYSLNNGIVSQVVVNGLTYGYNQTVSGNIRSVTVTDPLSHATNTTADTVNFQLLTSTDVNGNKTTNNWDPTTHLLASVSLPEGNSTSYSYDGRGNLMTTIRHAKPSSGLADITMTANFPKNCANALTCNKPSSTIDGNNHQTDYTYDPNSGYVATATAPADQHNVRPQTRYTYGQLQASIMSSSGTLQPSGAPIWLPSTISTCRSGTAPSCVGTDNETKTFFAHYDNNLNVVGIQAGPGGGSATPTITTSMSYDAAGDVLTSTDANNNQIAYVYDADRARVGMISPDPDGSGGNAPQAVRTTYGANGKVSMVEQGTVPSQSPSDWSNFNSHRQVVYAYDGADRLMLVTATSAAKTYTATQYSYDPAGRLLCTALRMNRSSYSSLPTSACTPAQSGPFGPDRITQNDYNTDNTLKDQIQAVGTTAMFTGPAYTYTLNGKVQTITDGAGNLTTYVYDGFDRLSQTRYPDKTSKNMSSANDYEQYGYDNNGNMTFRFLRVTGNGINYGYDALNRLISKSGSAQGGGSDNPILARTFDYDLFGNMIQAQFTTSGKALGFTYDALGRNLTASSYLGTIAKKYDAGGRRLQLTWADGNYVNYQYDHVGHVTSVLENGGTQLASLSYDDDGRRTALCFAGRSDMCNSYGYDAIGTLNQLNISSGTSVGTSIALRDAAGSSTGADPAGEVGVRTNSNDTYAYTQATNRATAYTSNNLNQYTSVGGNAIGYDDHGNVTNINGSTYGYDGENLLTSLPGNTISYDPLNRYANLAGNGSSGTDTLSDGDDTIALYTGGTENRRFVYLPGGEPIVWYEGTGVSTRRYLQSDERGSVIRVADGSNNTFVINTYDEYGNSGTGNLGRIQYIGQARIGSTGLYYFHARFYSPSIGRFMSTDPIGYGDGTNLYSYAHANPIKESDPSGKLAGNFDQIECQQDCTGSSLVDQNNAIQHLQEIEARIEQAFDQLKHVFDGTMDDSDPSTLSGFPYGPASSEPLSVPGGASNALGLLSIGSSGYGVGSVVTDANGDPIISLGSGRALLEPYPGSLNMAAKYGQEMGSQGFLAAAEGLFSFAHGGEFDFQRFGGGYYPQYRDLGNVAIGVYGASSGLSYQFVLEVNDIFSATMSHWPSGTPMLGFTPSSNYFNILQGYSLYGNGSVGR